jgi:hypothetical protein
MELTRATGATVRRPGGRNLFVGWARNEDRSLGTRGSWGRVSLQEVCPLPSLGLHPVGRENAVPPNVLCLVALPRLRR